MYNFLSQVQISPDGKKVAYVATTPDLAKNGYNANLYRIDAESGENACLTNSGRVKGFCWQGAETLLYTVPVEADDAFPDGQTVLYRQNAGSAAEEVCRGEGSLSLEGVLTDGSIVFSRVDNLTTEAALEGLAGHERLAARLAEKERNEVCTVFDEYPFWFNGKGVINKTRKTLYLWDGKELKRITPPRFRVMEVCVEGMKIAYAGCMVEPIEKELVGVYCYDAEKSKITCLLPEDEYYIEGMTFWGDSLAYCGTKMDRYSCAQCPDLLLLNLETGARTLLCDTDDEINVGNPVGSDCRMGGGYVMRADGEYLYFLTGVYDATHLWRIDRTGKMEKLLEKDGSIDCFDVQNGAVYCVAMYDMRLQELYRFAEGKLTRLSSWNDDFFLTKPPVIPQPLQFINSDGVQIDGFVMTPTDHVPGKKTPVILDIHGGPHLTYGVVYYHEMQYWANHGYYVIYCNPRGGESRGNEFGYICGRFGTIDYDDIMAFCDEALKAYPDMDEKHMGVTGGSYGGFMTNWIIGHTNRFAAAASQRGIANFVSMEGTSDIGTLFAERQILATTHTNLDKMWKQSPLKYADCCTTPTLFIHSEEDYRCWMVEALQMYSTLIHHGVPTRLCLFHGENHELSRGGKPKGRIRRLQEITAWMDKYLKEE